MNKQTTISLLSVLIAGTAVASISACAEARQTSVPSVHKLTRTQKLLKAKIESDMAKADGLMLNGKFALAADLYHQALNRDLRSTEARLGLAMALGKQFKLEAADELFNDVLMLDPQNARAHGGKAM
ncbi:MAG TPA: tetratricopeptide repeat protein, partial [Candidatus Obscuribacterales bacterium]